MTATRYLNGQEIKVAATSLDLISTITGFDIVELWISEKKSAIVEEHDSTTYDGDEGLHLVHVQVTDELISRHPGIITGAHPNRDERVHALSPEVKY